MAGMTKADRAEYEARLAACGYWEALSHTQALNYGLTTKSAFLARKRQEEALAALSDGERAYVLECLAEGGFYEEAVELAKEAAKRLEEADKEDALEAAKEEAMKTTAQPAKFFAHNPTLLATFGGYRLWEHPTRGDEAPVYMSTPSGALINTGFYDLGDFAYHDLGDNNPEGLALCREIEGGF